MCMTVEPKNPENIKIFIPSNDIKDEFGCIDKMFSDITKLELNFLEYKAPNNLSKEEYFEQICNIGLKERYGERISDEIMERYKKEKSVILKFDCVDVFLHYYDIIQAAKENNIMIGTGRGSAVSSLICYILGITNVDPIKYNLVFERFISSDYFSYPDIELDIESQDSDILIDFIRQKYGSQNIAIAYQPSFSENIEDESVFKTILFVNEYPIRNYVPINKIAPDTYLTVEPYEKFEKSHCLKFNFHFMKVLDRIKQSQIDVNSIQLDDENVFSLFQKAKTKGIYNYGKLHKEEIEYLKNLKPERIDDLSAFYALNRLGPLKLGMFDKFINAKNSKSKNKYSPLIESILCETYGQIIYQEQIIQILNVIGGFSLSESDGIRRHMAKNNHSKMMSNYEKNFIENAMSKEIEYTNAKDLWDKMYKLSACCFMKSQAISVTLLSYYDAYIKEQNNINTKNEISDNDSSKKRITIMGIGGGGSNIVNHLKDKLPEGYYFNLVCVNTDKQLLDVCETNKVLLGAKIANGLGCGGNPERGKNAAEESKQEIARAILGSDKLILINCLGGGTGTGATPVIAEAAQEFDIETTVFSTIPFSFEGKKRRLQAEKGLAELKKYAQVKTFNNDTILKTTERVISMKEAFKVVEEAIYQEILSLLTGE